MKAEVCGVLIGTMDNDRTVIEACIAGVNAAQGGAHVTFTQDTWEHIYKIKDQQYPDDKIVGWYHSHPGFGVFLSEHDLFIHENFFSSPQQIAWVYDPHTDEEGCFGWVGGKTEKLTGIRTGYSRSVEVSASTAGQDGEYEAEDLESQVTVRESDGSREPAWIIWTSRILGYIAILALGLVGGYLLTARQTEPKIRAYQDLLRELEPEMSAFQVMVRECQPELLSCQARYQRTGPLQPVPPGAGAPGVQNPEQPVPQGKVPRNSGKGPNGKH
jgi:proteasome lid subunit RPN8/RPN11